MGVRICAYCRMDSSEARDIGRCRLNAVGYHCQMLAMVSYRLVSSREKCEFLTQAFTQDQDTLNARSQDKLLLSLTPVTVLTRIDLHGFSRENTILGLVNGSR